MGAAGFWGAPKEVGPGAVGALSEAARPPHLCRVPRGSWRRHTRYEPMAALSLPDRTVLGPWGQTTEAQAAFLAPGNGVKGFHQQP